jgi:serine/threonine protein kinase
VIGQTISHYRVLSRLGSGGMGVVYEAEDLTLGRRVALKFLPPEVASEPAALERFLLEARAASALNHPNICTIYAVENAEGQTFIAMELLQGQSLEMRLHGGALPLDQLLEISIQLSDALDAAHAQGILHRDIKPANIFITPRGQAKILDFGLAKLTADAHLASDATQTATARLTSPGSTVGTVAYMSPEQARGETLDSRSDLFSLGDVIYQMATGRLAFSGATSAVIFNAILEKEPIAVTDVNPQLPPRLEEIVHRVLEKDRELRYQSAADLRGDLKRLKRDVESSRKTESSSSRGISSSKTSATTQPTAAREEPRPASSRTLAVVKQNRVSSSIGALVVLLVLAAAGYGVYALLRHPAVAPFETFSVTKQTQTGRATHAAISPDGKYILNVVAANGQEALWLRNVPTNSNAQVIPPEAVHYTGLRFSRDGNYLYFVRSEEASQELEFLYRAPLLGGSPEKLVSDIDSNITFSPDGNRFAFLRYNDPEPGKYQLVIYTLDNGSEHVLASGPVSSNLFFPAWSPDGTKIACVILQPANAITGLITVDVASGKQQQFFAASTGILGSTAWLPGGTGLLALIRDQQSNFTRNQFLYISYPRGQSRQITRDINDYADLSVSADGRSVATVLNEGHWNIFAESSQPPTGAPMQLTTGAPVSSFTWTPKGQVIFAQELALFSVDPSTGNKNAINLVGGGLATQPSACANGKYVLFALAGHEGSTSQNIWRLESESGELKQLSNGKLEQFPVCSPDGQWVYFGDTSSGGKFSRVSIEGGGGQKLSDVPLVGDFGISPDGKMAAFATVDHLGSHEEKLVLIDTSSGSTLKELGFERQRYGPVRFSPDGNAVVYPLRHGDVANLWRQPLDGKPGKLITNFNSELIGDSFGWSFDKSKLAVIRGHSDRDVVLIKDSRE